MRRLGWLVVLVALGACEGTTGRGSDPTTTPPDPVSVLLVTIDTLRADGCSAYGNPSSTTPNLDRLSRTGALAERAYSASDLTNPSHATLMTGLLPSGHGVYTLRSPLPEAHETLAEELSSRGYRTAAVVSVNHLRPDLSGLGQGFDRFEFPAVERAADDASATARARLAELAPPLLLWVHLFDPHMPYAPPEPYRAYVLAQVSRRPVPPLELLLADAHVPFPYRDWLGGQDLTRLPALYLGDVMNADAALGRIVAMTRRRAGEVGLVVTADHGEGFGEHGIYWNHFGLFEETLQVPLVVRGPTPVVPKLVRGLVPSTEVRAIALRLAERGEWTPAARDEALAEMRFGGASALVEGRYKIVDGRNAPAPLPRGVDLWDLALDPGESSALAADAQAPIRARLRARLGARLEDEKARGHGIAAEAVTDAETRDKMRALGYVE